MPRHAPPLGWVRALRTAAALVALALVGAQLTSIGHHVLVAHYLCATHGTLHHGSAPEARAVERDLGPAAAPGDDADHGGHDDCSFPAKTPAEMDVAEPPRLVAIGAPAEVEESLTARAPSHTAIALLALAPKLSPPGV